MCRLSLLQSHSTNVSCINKNNNTFNCNRSVAPGDRVNIKCKIKYSFDENAKQHFVCKENGEWDGDRTQCKAECGVLVQKGTPNIVGGQESFPNEVPWNTAIYHNDIQICGGTIISGLILNVIRIVLFSMFCDVLLFISRINCFISSSLF